MRVCENQRVILGPPGCVDKYTEYLSPNGWRKIDAYTDGEVCQYHLDTHTTSWVIPDEYIVAECDEMFHIKTKYGLDQMLSFGHRVLWYSKSHGKTTGPFTQPALQVYSDSELIKYPIINLPSTVIPPGGAGISLTDEQIKVMVAVIADGSIKEGRNKCCIRVKKERKKDRLRGLLFAANISYTESDLPCERDTGFVRFFFVPPIRKKIYDEYWWGCSVEQLKVVADELVHWDGCIRENKTSLQFFSSVKASADFAQYAYLSLGKTARLRTTVRKDDSIEYDVIASDKKLLGIFGGTVHRDNFKVVPTEDGKMYCFKVHSSYLLLRRNGCVFITGNTGKSTFILNDINDKMEKGTPPDRIALVSFTKKAVTEVVDRAIDKFSLKKSSFPMWRTIHSLAFNGLGVSKKDMVSKEHYKEYGEHTGYRFTGTWDESEGVPVGDEKGDTLLFLDNLARITRKPLKAVWEENYDVCEWDELERFQDSYQDFKSANNVMDFTDLLYGYVSMCDPLYAEEVYIDEGQDLSAAQWMVLKHAFGNSKRVMIAGDDDQCQPAGTMVHTTKGVKPIEELDEQVDKLLSYSSGDAYVYGHRNRGYTFKKNVRPYTGNMYRLTCGDNSSDYTPNHKCLAKWTNERLDTRRHIVYLMRKGKDYRIGMCELWRGGSLRLATRAKVEKADGAWILGIYHDKEEARLYEQIYSHKYSLPQMCFGGDENHINLIKRFYELVDTEENATQMLVDLGQYVEYPLIDYIKNPVSKYGETSFKTYACNVIPEIMLIPNYEPISRKITWCKPEKTPFYVIEENVYSMDVEKYHTYIADNIITHNSIYKWSGSDVDAFLALEGDKQVLSKSYRLPRQVHQFATNLVSKIESRFDKPFTPRDSEGQVSFFNNIYDVDLNNDEQTLFLVRNNYLSTKITERLHELGLPYTNKGYSSIRGSHVKAIYAMEKLRKQQPITGAEAKAMYDNMRIGYYLERGKKTHIANLNDTEEVDFAKLNQNYGLKDLAPWYTALEGLHQPAVDYYRAVLSNGYSLTATPKVAISTIHAAKGGEADHVVVLSDLAYRTHQEYEKQPDNERRVAYVAVTRAKERLSIIQPQSKLYFDYFAEGN